MQSMVPGPVQRLSRTSPDAVATITKTRDNWIFIVLTFTKLKKKCKFVSKDAAERFYGMPEDSMIHL